MKNPVLSLNNKEIQIFHWNVLVIPQTNCLQQATFMYFRSEVISNPQIVVLHHHEDSSYWTGVSRIPLSTGNIAARTKLLDCNIPFAQTMITSSWHPVSDNDSTSLTMKALEKFIILCKIIFSNTYKHSINGQTFEKHKC